MDNQIQTEYLETTKKKQPKPKNPSKTALTLGIVALALAGLIILMFGLYFVSIFVMSIITSIAEWFVALIVLAFPDLIFIEVIISWVPVVVNLFIEFVIGVTAVVCALLAKSAISNGIKGLKLHIGKKGINITAIVLACIAIAVCLAFFIYLLIQCILLIIGIILLIITLLI